MQISFISIEELLEVIPSDALSKLPLNQNPYFLLLSANHLKENFHLLNKSDFEDSEICPFFIWVKSSQESTLGFLPILRVENSKNGINLIPAKKMEESIFYKSKKLTSKELLLLEQTILEEIGKTHFQVANIGWNLSDSLFSIFGWFPQDERKEMVKRPTHFHFEEVAYENGEKKLKEFYKNDLEKKKNFPALIRRNVDLFQNAFPKDYRLLLIKSDQACIGATSFIDYSDKIYQMEFVGNTIFNKFYPKILFHLFQFLKKEKKKVLYPAFFEWCLIPFIAEIVRKDKLDMSQFMKKAAQTKARNAKELDL